MTWAEPANVCLPTQAGRPDTQRTKRSPQLALPATHSRQGVTRHAEWARMGRPASGGAGMTGGACGVVVAGVRVGTTEWERPARLKFAA